MQRISQAFQQKAIVTMASGGQPPSFRFYLHAQQTDGTRFLVELLADTTKVCSPSCVLLLEEVNTNSGSAILGNGVSILCFMEQTHPRSACVARRLSIRQALTSTSIFPGLDDNVCILPPEVCLSHSFPHVGVGLYFQPADSAEAVKVFKPCFFSRAVQP